MWKGISRLEFMAWGYFLKFSTRMKFNTIIIFFSKNVYCFSPCELPCLKKRLDSTRVTDNHPSSPEVVFSCTIQKMIMNLQPLLSKDISLCRKNYFFPMLMKKYSWDNACKIIHDLAFLLCIISKKVTSQAVKPSSLLNTKVFRSLIRPSLWQNKQFSASKDTVL